MVCLVNAWELFSNNNKSLEEHHLLTTKAHYHRCYYNKTWTILFLYAYPVSWKKQKTLFAWTVKLHLPCKTSSLSSNIEIIYVINLTKFGVDQSQGWGLVSSQILWFAFTRKPSITLHSANAHAGMPDTLSHTDTMSHTGIVKQPNFKIHLLHVSTIEGLLN